MIRFRPGILILGALLVAILLFPFWPSWQAGARAADEPRAFNVEGHVVGARYDAKTRVASLQISTLTPGGWPHAALDGNASNEKIESERFLAECP